MRESIGGTWITQLVIVFIFVFVAFLALSLNYSKAFRVKNETLTFIEKNEGFTTKTIERINNYLIYSGYTTTGKCQEGSFGILNLNSSTVHSVTSAEKNKQYYYCVSKVGSSTTNFKYRAYYKVKLFFKFNLPVVGDIFTFDINGQTKDIIYPADNIDIINYNSTSNTNTNNVQKENNICTDNSNIIKGKTNRTYKKGSVYNIKLLSGNKAKIWYVEDPSVIGEKGYSENKIKLKMLRRGSTQICAESQNGSNCDCITITVE